MDEKIISFWKWFDQRQAEHGFHPSEDPTLLSELTEKLRAIDEGLVFKIGKSDSTFARRLPNMKEGLNELSITSKLCRRSSCQAAIHLVSQAKLGVLEPESYNIGQAMLVSPNLIVTLGDHPPCTEASGLHHNNLVLDYDKFFASISKNKNLFDLTIFTDYPPETDLNKPNCVLGMSPLIDNVVETMLGEYIVENLLGTVTVKPLSERSSSSIPIRKASVWIIKNLSMQQQELASRIVKDTDVSFQSIDGKTKLRTAWSWLGCRFQYE